MTKQQLMRFIKRRNASMFDTNLQFQIDAEACGFRIGDLGKATWNGYNAYVWETPYGTLREVRGKLSLEAQDSCAA